MRRRLRWSQALRVAAPARGPLAFRYGVGPRGIVELSEHEAEAQLRRVAEAADELGRQADELADAAERLRRELMGHDRHGWQHSRVDRRRDGREP